MNRNLLAEIKEVQVGLSGTQLLALKNSIIETLAYQLDDPFRVMLVLESVGLL